MFSKAIALLEKREKNDIITVSIDNNTKKHASLLRVPLSTAGKLGSDFPIRLNFLRAHPREAHTLRSPDRAKRTYPKKRRKRWHEGEHSCVI